MASNDDDRRQWRKQGVAVGAAASKTQAKRCGCWVPQPGQWHCVSNDGEGKDAQGGTMPHRYFTTEISDGTAVLTLKNLPASVLTGSDSSKALAVTCSIKMDTILLGDISTSAKMSIWVER